MWLVPLLSLFVFPLSFPFSFLQGFFLVSIYILTASQYMPGAQSSLLCSKCLYSLSGSPKCMWPRNFKYNLYSINICTFCLNKLLLCSTCCSPISLYKTVIILPSFILTIGQLSSPNLCLKQHDYPFDKGLLSATYS